MYVLVLFSSYSINFYTNIELLFNIPKTLPDFCYKNTTNRVFRIVMPGLNFASSFPGKQKVCCGDAAILLRTLFRDAGQL